MPRTEISCGACHSRLGREFSVRAPMVPESRIVLCDWCLVHLLPLIEAGAHEAHRKSWVEGAAQMGLEGPKVGVRSGSEGGLAPDGQTALSESPTEARDPFAVLARLLEGYMEYRMKTKGRRIPGRFYAGGGHGDPTVWEELDDIARECGIE